MTPGTQALKEAGQALEAFETERQDPLNQGRTFTEADKQAYKARRHYLGLVYYDNNHRFILSLIAQLEKAEAALSAMQPRLIEEAPKDGTVVILMAGEIATQGAWHEGIWVVSVPPYSRKDFDNLMPWVSAGPLRFIPTHFIHLSALPKVIP